MDFTLIVALVIVASGVFRLYLIRSGKLPVSLGYQKYLPYVFIVVGVVLVALALYD